MVAKNCMQHYKAFIVCFSALPSIHLLLLHCVDNFDAVSLFCYVCFILVNCCSSRSSIGIVHSVRNLSRSLLSWHSRPLSAWLHHRGHRKGRWQETVWCASMLLWFISMIRCWQSSWASASADDRTGPSKKVPSLLLLFWCQHKEAYIHHM